MGAGGDILATRFTMGSTFSNTGSKTELSVIALIQVIKIIRERMLFIKFFFFVCLVRGDINT